MAIDLATASSTTTTVITSAPSKSTSESIFSCSTDSPNSKDTPLSPTAQVKSSQTMKLDSTPLVLAQNGNGTIAAAAAVSPPAAAALSPGRLSSNLSHHKGFLEHIRRSLAFGSVTPHLQPLTKLWLFRRQSSRRASSGKTPVVRVANHQSPLLPATKLDSNGNGVFQRLDLANETRNHIRPLANGNGTANGYSNGHTTVNETAIDGRTFHADEIPRNSMGARDVATCDIEEIALDTEELFTLEGSPVSQAADGKPYNCSGHVGEGVINNEKHYFKKNTADEASEKRHSFQDNEPGDETFQMLLGTGSSNSSSLYFTSTEENIHDHCEVFRQRGDSLQFDACSQDRGDDEEAMEMRPSDNGSQRTTSQLSTASCTSALDVQVPQRAITSTTEGSLINGGHVTPPSQTQTPTEDFELTDEQILESLRQVVRLSTKTDLSKRASIKEVFELLDTQMRLSTCKTMQVNSLTDPERVTDTVMQEASDGCTLELSDSKDRKMYAFS